MKKTIIGSVIMFATISIFLIYSGLFTPVVIEEKAMGPFNLAYEEHRGDYGKTGDILERVRGSLEKEHSIKSARGFGIFYDDPKKVPVEKLRSEVGYIVEETDAARLKSGGTALKFRTYPRLNCVVAEFPLRNTVSMFIGLMRVYPEMDRYIKEKGYSPGHSMEIYSLTDKKVTYIFPAVK
ncbi:MAG: GyrI-like domain-containing protein [Spirochaetes bacterium]|nr:GyrI-like domain-containing protein [Spirochaetota bacterium]